jgi:hypothetical protein
MKATALLLLMLLPTVAFSGTLEETRQLELAAKDIQTLKIDCGSGSLTVIGAKGIDRISVSGKIEARGITVDEFKNGLKLKTGSKGLLRQQSI